VSKVDHLVLPGTEKIIGRHLSRCFSQVLKAVILIPRRFLDKMNRLCPAPGTGGRDLQGDQV
jgi:hypothetical protein